MDIGKYFASKKRELSSNNSADGDVQLVPTFL